MYNEVVAPLMEQVLRGYSCTVFAYGQTGSGKTHTMEGRGHDEAGEHTCCWEDDPNSGIIPRAFHQIFTELGNKGIDFTVRASYEELYNGRFYDLLSPREQCEPLRTYEDKNKGFSIAGAEQIIVRNGDELNMLLRRGAEKRRTAATLMNKTSSRSHSIFTIYVEIREAGPPVNGEKELVLQGKLILVDLAGSENIGRSGSTDQRAREAGKINTSLLALGRVITALATGAAHVPYRESMLTRMLQHSLGGKTMTTVVATLSPARSNFEESANTLDYAQRAKNIKKKPAELLNQQQKVIITRQQGQLLLVKYNEAVEQLNGLAGLPIALDRANEEIEALKAELAESKKETEEAGRRLESIILSTKEQNRQLQLKLDVLLNADKQKQETDQVKELEQQRRQNNLKELEETAESESQLLLLSMQTICKELMQKMAEQQQKAQADQQQKADREFVAAQKQMLLQMVAQLMEANKQLHSSNDQLRDQLPKMKEICLAYQQRIRSLQAALNGAKEEAGKNRKQHLEEMEQREKALKKSCQQRMQGMLNQTKRLRPHSAECSPTEKASRPAAGQQQRQQQQQ